MFVSKEQRLPAGYTLIEVMVALAIASIFLAGMYSVLQAQVRGQATQDVSMEMTQNARSAMEMIAADIRMAGCDPEGAGAGILIANNNELHLTMDIGGGPNGEPNGNLENNEDIRYAVNANGNLGREIGGAGGLQPIARNCYALDFVYLDPSGNPFVPLNADDREDISAIQVCIVVGSAAAGGSNRGFLVASGDNISYRNLQGVEILPPQGDTIRRFQLSETIDCRNL